MIATELKLQTEIEALKRRVRDLERAVSRASIGAVGGGIDVDCLFVGGKILVPPAQTSDFLKVELDGSGVSWVGALPEENEEDSEVFDVRKNHLHLPGNMA